MRNGFSFIYMGEWFQAVSPWTFSALVPGDSTSVLLLTVHSRTDWDTRQLLPSAPLSGPHEALTDPFSPSSDLGLHFMPDAILLQMSPSVCFPGYCADLLQSGFALCHLTVRISIKTGSLHPDLNWRASNFSIALSAPGGCGFTCISRCVVMLWHLNDMIVCAHFLLHCCLVAGDDDDLVLVRVWKTWLGSPVLETQRSPL